MRAENRESEILKPALHALKAMARGGMYDVVGGGFSRYSVDNFWRVPHFEKMLYDNAQLARAYLHAWQITSDPFFKQIVIETLDFITREMLHPDGGFYSSLDADSEGEEGKFYVWTLDEIRLTLKDDSDFFEAAYGITARGNWEGHTVLQRTLDDASIAARFKLDPETVSAKLGLVAYHVFKESVRDKVLYNLVFFAVLMIGASYLIGQLTAGQDVKIIKDLGLAASSVFGLFIAVFIGVGLVWDEVDRRSVYNLLVKPLRRHEFIVGKFAGLALTLLVNIAVMAAALYAMLGLMLWLQPDLAKVGTEAPVLDPQLLKAFGLLYVQLLVVTSVALFFSTFSGPTLSAAFTFGLYKILILSFQPFIWMMILKLLLKTLIFHPTSNSKVMIL